MMKRIFLDTDLGDDCDDVAALALLLQLEREGKCFIEGISSSLAREGSTATIRAICDYYGFEKPVGKMLAPVIPCDMRKYGKAIKEAYGYQDVDKTGVEVFREVFAKANERIDIIAIGPLTTIKDCMKSLADDISSMSGMELIKEKAGTLYLMGGSFLENYKLGGRELSFVEPEWNIQQDVEAAKFVIENYPHDIIISPYEAGEKVYTRIPKTGSPLRFAFDCAARNAGIEPDKYQRNSWDPQTCLCAIEDCSEFFTLSEKGDVVIAENGATKFEPNVGGNCRILLLKENYRGIEKRINELIVALENGQ